MSQKERSNRQCTCHEASWSRQKSSLDAEYSSLILLSILPVRVTASSVPNIRALWLVHDGKRTFWMPQNLRTNLQSNFGLKLYRTLYFKKARKFQLFLLDNPCLHVITWLLNTALVTCSSRHYTKTNTDQLATKASSASLEVPAVVLPFVPSDIWHSRHLRQQETEVLSPRRYSDLV